MSAFGEDVLAAARSRLGYPFRHHYEPFNYCQKGAVTLDSCMETGMDAEGGFDCSGLVIASICDVLGMRTADWPRDYRHLIQMEALAKQDHAEPGDALIFMPDKSRSWYHSSHMGIFVARQCVVHASGTGEGVVEEGAVDGHFLRVDIVGAETLAQIAMGQESL